MSDARQTRALKAEALLEEAVKALELFAAIKPSSLYPGDGSEAEEYVVVLRDGSLNPVEFTGTDLARARQTLAAIEKDRP